MENDVILNDKTDIWYTFNFFFFFANDIGIKSINHNYDIEIIFSHICNLIRMLTPSSAYN